ncbi:uncharacterized protein PFLUO_LOCUS279 [Penicillium psychrofluorescens]|uniref:uncharacterized protein n=1 Tax=Penicillium psychrofluorescens TaxID=3158075 RepID=UPI003CCDC07C
MTSQGLSLPPGTSQFRYQSWQQLRKSLEREQDLYTADKAGTRSEYVLIKNVDELTFQQLRENKLNFYSLPQSFHSYLPQPQLLILRMESQAHGRTNAELMVALADKLTKMGMDVLQNLKMYTGVLVDGPDRKKRPDAQFKPTSLPQGRLPKWPSMVIEVAHSQSASQLRQDALWWIHASEGDVKLVLAVHVPKDKKIITYHLWSLTDRLPRRNKESAPEIRQQVIVKKNTDTSIVASDNLTIPFELLFLRNPQGTETDIVLDKKTLERLAGASWDEI